MEMELIGAKLVRGSFTPDGKTQEINFNKVKFFSLMPTQYQNQLGMEVGILEGVGDLWERGVAGMRFPGRFNLTMGNIIKAGKVQQIVTAIEQNKDK